MRHPFLGAVIGQRQDRAAVGQKLFGALRDRGQRVAADQHGLGKIVGGGLEIAAVELVLVGERDRVHHEIDLAPFLLAAPRTPRRWSRRSVTSQWPSRIPPSSLASGSTRFFSASPCQVSAISAPASWHALAMPQAIERLLATPRITPRLPCIRPDFCDIGFPIAASDRGLEVHQHSTAVQPKSAAGLTLFARAPQWPE